MANQTQLTKIAMFKGKKVRKTIFNNEWWFSVIDVVSVLTESENPRDYWYKMKIREKEESKIELSTICRQLKLESSDGKKYTTDCAIAGNARKELEQKSGQKVSRQENYLKSPQNKRLMN